MNIRELYNDPKFAASFAGKKRFVNAVVSKNKNVKRKNVENELRKIDSYTLHKPTTDKTIKINSVRINNLIVLHSNKI